MRRAADRRRHVPLPAAAALVLGALLAAGCQRGPAGASVEREGSSGTLRYRVASRLEPRHVTLGDPVRWTLRAELPDSATPVALIADSAGPSLDVATLRTPVRRARKDRVEWTWGATVRGFDLGATPLPEVRLAVRVGTTPDTIAFPLDTLAVDSLTQAEADSLAPDRGPIRTELRPIDYVVAGVLLLALIAAILLTVRAVRRARARRRAAATAAAAPEPPTARLRRELAALRAEGGALPRDLFYDRLSVAVRDYAAAVTGIPARDRTTTELTRELRAQGGVPAAAIDAVASALDRADLARFARRGDPWEEALRTLAEAERLPERLPDPADRKPAADAAPAGARSAGAGGGKG
ncbi:MAG: hypothetical protein ACM3JJ_01615 [Hyphomicrobiales bacterium]